MYPRIVQTMASIEVVGDAAAVQRRGELEQVESSHPWNVLRPNTAILRITAIAWGREDGCFERDFINIS